MKRKNLGIDKLEPLKWYPRKVYTFDNTGQQISVDDEKIDWQRNDIIKNYSGGISIPKIHANVRPLRTGYYKVLRDDVGGDAPKDFISVYESGEADLSKPRQWNKHIAKVGHKWYPLESISEHLLNRIGEVLGLNMAKSQLRVIHGQLRFLSRYFLKEDEIMVHGAQIYSTYLLENDDHFVQEIENQNLARKLLTFQFTEEAIKGMFPYQCETIMNHLVELLVFDAITGNNDRHFYNWAIITHIEGKYPPKFSPIYDSARGLLWNEREVNIEKKYYYHKNGKTLFNHSNIDKYLQSSRPKIGWEGWQGTQEINHFQLIEQIIRSYPIHRNTCKRLLNNVYLQAILKLLKEEFTTFYTPQRLFLMEECLRKRFQILNQLCKIDHHA